MKSSRAPQPKLLEEHGSWTPLCWMQGKWISCVTFAGLGGQSQATITRHPAQKSTDLACCPDVLWNVLWNPFGRHASHLLWHQIFCTCHIAANQNGPHWIHGLRSANFGVAPAMWNKDERKMRPRNAQNFLRLPKFGHCTCLDSWRYLWAMLGRFIWWESVGASNDSHQLGQAERLLFACSGAQGAWSCQALNFRAPFAPIPFPWHSCNWLAAKRVHTLPAPFNAKPN